jgi:hypothetical protein
MVSDNWWNNISLVSQVPSIGRVSPGDLSIYQLQPRMDWTTHSATLISFGTSLIGATGGIGALKTGSLGRVGIVRFPGILGNGSKTGGLGSRSGLTLHTVGSAGLDLGTLQNIKAGGSPAFGRTMTNPSVIHLRGIRP